MPVTVSQLAIAPVKGMRLHRTSEIRLGQHGIAGDREFLVTGEDGKLLLTSRVPALLQIEPAWDQAREVLELRFPDGTAVTDTPEPGAPRPPGCMTGGRYPAGSSPGRSAPHCPATSASRCTCSDESQNISATMTSPSR
ncbi:MAG: MOSC N-terminal beta barrel domain-containing protein [Streptosporangiaceae bacterium]